MSKSLVRKGLSFVRGDQDGVSRARRKLGTEGSRSAHTYIGGRKGPTNRPPGNKLVARKRRREQSLREVLLREEKMAAQTEGGLLVDLRSDNQ